MKKVFLLVLFLIASITFGQARYNPYQTSGWDVPWGFTGADTSIIPSWSSHYGYYGLGIMEINSNPGGWLNYNYWKIDSLLQALVVYTDTSQIIVENDTLKLAPYIAAAIDTQYYPTWFDLVPIHPDSVPHKEGRVFYDSVRKAYSYYVEEEDVTLNAGRELWIRIYNNTASTITNGMPVYPTGAVAGNIGTVAPAQADSDATSNVIGLATHSIEASTYGYITRFGDIGDVNTVGLQLGATFYLSPSVAGGIVTTKPDAPNNAIRLGGVTSVGATGSLFAIIERFNDINGEAEASFVDSTAIIQTTSIGVYERITNAWGTLLQYNTDVGHDINVSGDTIYCVDAGVYEIILSMSFEGATGGVFLFRLKQNGTFIPNVGARRKTGSADVGNIGFGTKVRVTANTPITLWVANTGNTNTCTMKDGTVLIRQVR
jgi:hypothetical protein